MKSGEIKKIFDDILVKRGFKRKGATWWRASDSVVSVINLQKDASSPHFWLNLAFWIRVLGEPNTMPPAENHCHVSGREDSLFRERARERLRLLRYDDEAGNERDRAPHAS